MSKIRISVIMLVAVFLSAVVVFTQNALALDAKVTAPNAEQVDDLATLPYEQLVPNTMYAQWCEKITGRLVTDLRCITPHGSKHTIISDEAGNAAISLEIDSLPVNSGKAFFEVAIAYQHISNSTIEVIEPDKSKDRVPVWFSFMPNQRNPKVATNVSYSPIGKGTYTKNGDHMVLKLSFEGLTPHANYSLWCVAIIYLTEQQISEQACA